MNNALYSAMMLVALLAFVTLFSAWVLLVSGCAAPQSAADIRLGNDLCIPQDDPSKDPCELEFWENQEFARRGR